jgi:hypothetical protein
MMCVAFVVAIAALGEWRRAKGAARTYGSLEVRNVPPTGTRCSKALTG